MQSISNVFGRFLIGTLAMWLSACGGGGSDASSNGGTPPVSYINWTNSANGTFIVDGANQSFQVRASDGSVVSSTNIALAGTKVNATQLLINGVLTGSVGNTASSAGSWIAIFRCNDGSPLTFNLSSSGFSWSCAGTTAPTAPVVPTPPSAPINPTAPPNSATPKAPPPTSTNTSSGYSYSTSNPNTSCISASHDVKGRLVLTNNCSVIVEVGWCYTSAPSGSLESRSLCKPTASQYSRSGVNYLTSGGGWGPGSSDYITYADAQGVEVVWIACVAPYIAGVLETQSNAYCVRP